MKTQAWQHRASLPFYKVSVAARYADVNRNTVSRWHRYYGDKALLSSRAPRVALSYWQLIELRVVRAMRTQGVSLKKIANARTYLKNKLDLEYPFASLKFSTDGKEVLAKLPDMEALVEVSNHGQQVFNKVLEQTLETFSYDEGVVASWSLFDQDKKLVIDPRVCSGAPNVKGICTEVIFKRFLMGETIEDLADDFGLTEANIRSSISFEQQHASVAMH